MLYQVLVPKQAIGVISKREYHKYTGIYKRHGNQYSRTLIVPDTEVFRIIRNEFKENGLI